jgi:hypothetical protein
MDFLKTNETITSLIVKGTRKNRLQGHALVALMSILMENTTLVDFDVAQNEFMSLTELADILNRNLTLKKLHISFAPTQTQPEMISQFLEAIGHRPTKLEIKSDLRQIVRAGTVAVPDEQLRVWEASIAMMKCRRTSEAEGRTERRVRPKRIQFGAVEDNPDRVWMILQPELPAIDDRAILAEKMEKFSVASLLAQLQSQM